MKSQIRLINRFFISFILIVDGICFVGLTNDFQILRNPAVTAVFWLITLIFILVLQIFGRNFLTNNKPGFFAGFYVFTGIFLAFYVPKLIYTVFLLLEYIIKLPGFIFFSFLSESGSFKEFMLGGPLNFISVIVLPVSILTFFAFISGILFGRFNFKVRPIEVLSPKLPAAFDGFKLIHISDLHLGSLYGNKAKIRRAVEMINRESPDLILFTGDLVNNLAEEVEGWTLLLSEMKSRLGNYSILGNHDYGEYYNWPDEKSRMDNMDRLISAHSESGFTLLLNRSISIRNGDEEIFIAGVENWGLPPFKQYGDLNKALQNIPAGSFTVLLSHDPSHWDQEVLGKTEVPLTLSGHTHGMQFGIRTKKFRWSPVQIKYPRWIGLYQQGYQYLHVNPGLGYIGYAGRIGIPPEISLITLKKST